MKIKKLMALLMSVTMVFTFGSCDDKEKNNESVAQIVLEDDGTFRFGSIAPDKKSYSSTYNGIKFQCPENWSFATNQILSQTNAIDVELLNDRSAELYKAAAEKTMLCDMQCMQNDSGNNVAIIYENIDNLEPEVDTETYSCDDYIENLKESFSQLTELSYTFIESSDITLAGKDFIKCKFECRSNIAGNEGIVMEQDYYVLKVDNYIMCIILSIDASTEKCETYEAFFSAVQ